MSLLEVADKMGNPLGFYCGFGFVAFMIIPLVRFNRSLFVICTLSSCLLIWIQQHAAFNDYRRPDIIREIGVMYFVHQFLASLLPLATCFIAGFGFGRKAGKVRRPLLPSQDVLDSN